MASTRNPRVMAAAKLHQTRARRRAGLTLLEGRHLIDEAIAAGMRLQTIFTVDDAPRGEWEVVTVTPAVLRRLADTQHPQGPIAVAQIPEPGPLPKGDCIVLHGVGDPGNVGTIIRSAAAFGFSVLAGSGTADLWAPKVVRAASGGHFRTWTGVRAEPKPQQLRPRSSVAAVVAGGEERLPEGPVALWVGEEGSGLPEPVVDACDFAVTIPMVGGTESLNVAVAASILMYAIRHRAER